MPEDVPVAVRHDPSTPDGPQRAARLARDLGLPLADDAPGAALLLTVASEGLELRDATEPGVRGARVDVGALDLRTGSGNLSKKQPLARAVGRRCATVADATAGLGHDAILLAAMGWRVTAIERAPALAALLRDGLRRAEADPVLSEALGGRLAVVTGDARAVLPTLDPAPDAVYVDPMYPERRKASALPKKSIRLVRRLVGDDPDASDLLEVALGVARQRVIVKRPRHAEPLGGRAPTTTHRSKMVRYDVYVPGAAAGADPG